MGTNTNTGACATQAMELQRMLLAMAAHHETQRVLEVFQNING